MILTKKFISNHFNQKKTSKRELQKEKFLSTLCLLRLLCFKKGQPIGFILIENNEKDLKIQHEIL